ncbi:MAG: class I SAM-dependent methyltransferase [Polyangiales bacterium]
MLPRAMPAALYDAPGVYDLLFSDRADDLRFYRALTPPGASVLEYGVGSGRVGLSLARDGADVTGVEPSAAMLSALAARAAEAPRAVRDRIRCHQGDARTFVAERDFERVYFPFNGVAHLHGADDLAAMFARVRAHLAPGGLFAFDCWIPEPRLLAGTVLESPRFPDPRTGEPVTLTERFRWEPLAQVLHVELTITPVLDPERAEVLTLAQRMFFPEETLLLLKHHGFDVRWRTTRWALPDEPGADDPEMQGAMLAYVCAAR